MTIDLLSTAKKKSKEEKNRKWMKFSRKNANLPVRSEEFSLVK